jgi:large subunit ribosomal protein L35
MPKMKTNTNVKKRVQVTGTGKLRRRQAFRSHLLEKKSARRRRRLSRETGFAPAYAKRVKRQLGG